MAAVQVCARCGVSWPVPATPAQWCPGCRGVLLSPTDPSRPEPRSRRNFRWVARRPGARIAPSPRGASGSSPTPSYREMPRWGLLDPPPAAPEESPGTRTERLGELAPTLLVATALLFAVGALAELFRYALLLRNRTSLISPTVLAVSDGLVSAAGVMAPVVAVCAAAASASWLVGARAAAFGRSGRTDPRRPAEVILGCLTPVLNLVLPGVYLNELAESNTKTRNLIRLWWVTWAVGAAMLVLNLAWRSHDSLQARANGVLVAALTDLVAVAVAVLTLAVMRRVDGLGVTGRPRELTRWVVAG
ncbi:DUF4328 domain-containing protein [Rhodococcus spelaei]|uniref:DUF4328 domain-containing protein n=1 Tax=Rhodococcus spelaei TaxID=2546320 RepID=A0A541BR22_9NOCA|nr:DUF4328 domain-containing protein [Rhodococcus spelaei]TQF74763.1 DUF4328 domain-containing protein [Rhodococcus spelaei]